jgi:hypothetical protein
MVSVGVRDALSDAFLASAIQITARSDRRGDERNSAGSFCGLSCGLKLYEPIIPK